MKDNTRLYITAGFLAILAIMFLLVAVSLFQLQSTTESMEFLVEHTNRKTAAANTMRDVVRLRAGSLKTMQLTQDIFDRDEEMQRFNSYAGTYRRAREQLVSLGMDEKESMLHEQLQQLTSALDQLPFEQREVLMLHMYGGLPLRAIARTNGHSANTVMSRYRYGLGKLRSLLNGEHDHEV